MEFADMILTPKLDNVVLIGHEKEPVFGTLCITGHHLILSGRKDNVKELWLLHKNIDNIEKRFNYNNNILHGGSITIKCKDLKIIVLQISTPQDFLNVATSIELLSTIKDIRSTYPFFYRANFNILEDGYAIFNTELEYAKLLAGDDWRISLVNQNYTVCPTYSAKLVVPKVITDLEITQSASFRDGGRFPIVSYRHENGAILMRSSQPISGPSAKRCRADESILNYTLVDSKKGLIIDTWGKKNSNLETDQHYSQWRKVTRPLGNVSSISGLLDSFSKLIEACNENKCSTDKWLTRLESSGWLGLILNVMNTACVVAQCLDHEGIPVLVHGGNGLDSTLIITSLVQIILNPDCRTVRGLQALIEREWLQGGFPFSTRHQNSCYSSMPNRSKTSASTFVLFLDCIYQLHHQFPSSFEFCVEFLKTLFENSFCSQFGTFLGDSELERVKNGVFENTTSLWSYINLPDVLKSILNPIYEPNQSVLWPSVAPVSIKIWTDLYFRPEFEMPSNTSRLKYQMHSLIVKEKELKQFVKECRHQVQDLCKEYQNLIKQQSNCNHS